MSKERWREGGRCGPQWPLVTPPPAIFLQVIDILRGKATRPAPASQPEPSPDRSATTSPESSSRLSSNGEKLAPSPLLRQIPSGPRGGAKGSPQPPHPPSRDLAPHFSALLPLFPQVFFLHRHPPHPPNLPPRTPQDSPWLPPVSSFLPPLHLPSCPLRGSSEPLAGPCPPPQLQEAAERDGGGQILDS